MPYEIPFDQLGARLDAEPRLRAGQQPPVLRAVAELPQAGPHELSLCASLRHLDSLRATRAGCVLLPARLAEIASEAPCPVLLVADVRQALLRAMELFYPPEPTREEPGVQPGALVDPAARMDPTARVEAGARVGPGAVVGQRTRVRSGAVVEGGARIGQGCEIGPNAVVRACCELGDGVRVGPGTVLGSDGFGLVEQAGALRRLPQVGKVVIEEGVELGAHCTVARATLGETRIGRGSRLDDQVHVGHNARIGERVIIAAQTGLSGSVVIGDRAVLGGQVGVADHRVVGPGAQVGAKSGVGRDVPERERVAGIPAVPVRRWLEQISLWRRIRKLDRRERPK
ncbi:MAG: UDP-3-O-(3-hydroxymyristoyl)glucosamine N-acyltransferase [Deltaproteobacteria bacterium]|nr:UDP-3-O-(3-hydroxymyristoyl)glucosamine N-acyltransferase [Deltaproteobacteria bacterium]